jgi:transcriptional activator
MEQGGVPDSRATGGAGEGTGFGRPRATPARPARPAPAPREPGRPRAPGTGCGGLYRSGRQAEALAAYQTARRVLVDELGIEPSAAIQELERAILRQDAGLELEQPTAPERSILVAWPEGVTPEPLLAVAEALARKPPREVIVGRLVSDRAGLAAAAESLKARSGALAARGVGVRSAVFTSAALGADLSRLGTEQAFTSCSSLLPRAGRRPGPPRTPGCRPV